MICMSIPNAFQRNSHERRDKRAKLSNSMWWIRNSHSLFAYVNSSKRKLNRNLSKYSFPGIFINVGPNRGKEFHPLVAQSRYHRDYMAPWILGYVRFRSHGNVKLRSHLCLSNWWSSTTATSAAHKTSLFIWFGRFVGAQWTGEWVNNILWTSHDYNVSTMEPRIAFVILLEQHVLVPTWAVVNLHNQCGLHKNTWIVRISFKLHSAFHHPQLYGFMSNNVKLLGANFLFFLK